MWQLGSIKLTLLWFLAILREIWPPLLTFTFQDLSTTPMNHSDFIYQRLLFLTLSVIYLPTVNPVQNKNCLMILGITNRVPQKIWYSSLYSTFWWVLTFITYSANHCFRVSTPFLSFPRSYMNWLQVGKNITHTWRWVISLFHLKQKVSLHGWISRHYISSTFDNIEFKMFKPN